ncbi:hypothetical protein L596_010622 [Steinernema carpocapsae]|uniref:Uncharacterized protein n=1 Tax=Steinernema carpocapsae TaxID=34508 RepID=A0A4U5PIU5_STECR|nr:hypothetical protein L596_010622 [Steinernema carpocapsae]
MNAGYTIPIQQMPQGPVQAPVYQYCVDKGQILIPATHGVVSGQPAGQHNPVYDPRIAQRPHVHKPEDLVQDEKIVQEPPAPLHNAIMQVISQNAGEKEQPLRYRSDPSLFCAEPNSDSMTCNQPTQKGVKRAAFRELPNMGCQAKISRVVETIVSDY